MIDKEHNGVHMICLYAIKPNVGTVLGMTEMMQRTQRKAELQKR